jgi:hypothetical protein
VPTGGCSRKRGLELRSPVNRVSALAGLDLHKLLGDFEPLCSREARQRVALGFEPETRTPLLRGRNADVGDERSAGHLEVLVGDVISPNYDRSPAQ